MSYQPPYPPSYPPPPYPPPEPAVPGAPEPRRRPVPVLISAVLMWIVALLALVSAIIGLATMSQVVDRFRIEAVLTAASPADIDSFVNVIRAATIVTAIILVIFALLLAGFAVGNLRGSNTTRVLTLVVCAIGVLCGCCGVIGAVGQTSATGLNTNNTDTQVAEELGRALGDAYPGWWLGVNSGLSGLQLLGYIVIAILLVLPVSNAYFRKPPPTPQWQPPAV